MTMAAHTHKYLKQFRSCKLRYSVNVLILHLPKVEISSLIIFPCSQESIVILETEFPWNLWVHCILRE